MKIPLARLIAVLCLLLCFSPYNQAQETQNIGKIAQTTGDCSQAINAGDNAKITIYCGVSKQVLDEILKQLKVNRKALEFALKELDTKDVAIQERESKIQEWAKKYKKLEQRLSEAAPEDKTAKLAKEKLDQGDLDSAEKLYYESLEKNLKALAEKQKAAASDAYNLAAIKELKLQYPEALSYYKKAVSLSSDNALYLNDYGTMLLKLADYKQAINQFEQALAIDRKTYGNEHPNVAIRLNNLGAAWKALGEYQKAIEFYEQALAIFSKKLGEDHPYTKTVRGNMDQAKEKLK